MCLEEVLTWLLDAEESLQNMGTVEDNDVEMVKQQFREHEVRGKNLFFLFRFLFFYQIGFRIFNFLLNNFIIFFVFLYENVVFSDFFSLQTVF